MKHDSLDLANRTGTQVELIVTGKSHWVPAIPHPMYVATGLPFWKRGNEKYWRPQCACGQIFDTLNDYNAHVVYWNSIYGIAELQKRTVTIGVSNDAPAN